MLNPRTEHTLGGIARIGLLALVHEAIMIRNMDGRINYWNRGASEMYGWTGKEAIGNNFP